MKNTGSPMLFTGGGSFEWNGSTCYGNRGLLERKKAVVVNSAQARYPTGDLPWVTGTVRAVESLKSVDRVLLTSVGLKTWDLSCWAAGNRGLLQIVAVVDDGRGSTDEIPAKFLDDFSLDPEKTCLILLPAPRGRPRSVWPERDALLLNLADLVIPVAVRPGGKMESLVNALGGKKRIDRSFSIEWKSVPRKPRGYRFCPEDLKKEVDPEFRGYLTHWTRAVDGPWPGERRSEYYRAVVESGTDYPRSAEKTLNRILSEKRIRGSCWKIRGGTSVVSFSFLAPSRAAGLMRWRSRYARYTIEPFGISVEREVAEEYGVRAVRYVGAGETAPETPACLLQGKGPGDIWPAEKEYRSRGDFDLSALPEGSWKPVNLSKYATEEPSI